MSENMGGIAGTWAGKIRSAATEAIQRVYPNMESETLTWFKLQILVRKFLLGEIEDNSLALDCGFHDAEELMWELRPLVLEELVPGILPEDEQMELGMFMMGCLEEQEDFLSLYAQALDDDQPEENLQQNADILREMALSLFSAE